MTIKFTCSTCSKKYTVPKTAAGKKSKCRKCNTPLTVPSSSSEEHFVSLDDLDEAHDLGEPTATLNDSLAASSGNPNVSKSKAVESFPLFLVGVGVGVIALVILILVVIFSSFSQSNNSAPSDSLAESTGDVEKKEETNTKTTPPLKSIPPENTPSSVSAIPEENTLPTFQKVKEKESIVKPDVKPKEPVNASNILLNKESIVIPWSAEVDFAPPYEFSGFKSKENLLISVKRSVELIVSDYPSPFILLNSDEYGEEGFLSLDLRTGRPARHVKGKYGLNKSIVLRPNGLHVAGISTNRKEVVLVSLKDGSEKKIKESNEESYDKISWTGSGLLFTYQKNSDYDPIISVWDIDAGQKKYGIDVVTKSNERIIKGTILPSIGGRYAVVGMGTSLSVFEMSTGKCVGTMPLPKIESRSNYQCEGMAFSPDGTKLAIVIGMYYKTWFLKWDMSNGKLLVATEMDEDPSESISATSDYDGTSLVWVPGTDALLYKGHILFDGESGYPVWNLPTTLEHPRVPLGPTQIVLPQKGKSYGDYTLSTYKIPTNELTTAIQLVRSGGNYKDAGLPTLANINFALTDNIKLPPESVPWEYLPDSYNGGHKQFNQTINLNNKRGSPVRAMLASNANQCVAHWFEKASVSKNIDAPSTILQRYSLDSTKSQPQAELTLSTRYNLKEVSPQGEYVILSYPAFSKVSKEMPDRLDIYSLSTNLHVAGWRPYRSDAEPRISFVSYIDEDHVLTSSPSGHVVLWKLPECQPVYSIKGLQPMAVSPNKHCIAMWEELGSRIVLYEPLTGKCLGALENSSINNTPNSSAFRADGNVLAAFGSGQFVLWDLTTGKVKLESYLNDSIIRMRWIDDRYLLANRRSLLDTKNRGILWKYDGLVLEVKGALDGRFWGIMMDLQNIGAGYYLKTFTIPSEAVKKRIENINNEDLLLAGPGSKVSISVQAKVPGVDMEKIKDALAEKMTSLGYVIDPNSTIQVTVSGDEQSTGKTLRYKQLVNGRLADLNIPVKVIKGAITITDKQSGLKWEVKKEFNSRGSFFEKGDVVENIQNDLRDRYYSFIKDAHIPLRIYTAELVGKSAFTIRGEVLLKSL